MPIDVVTELDKTPEVVLKHEATKDSPAKKQKDQVAKHKNQHKGKEHSLQEKHGKTNVRARAAQCLFC